VSLYSEQLAHLKKEISIISNKKKHLKPSKRFKKHQKQMIDFIHSIIKSVEIEVNYKTIILEKGDSKKGFIHIIKKHYNPNDLKTMDILNLPIIFKDAIEMVEKGVSNKYLNVYSRMKNQEEYKIITNEKKENKLVVTSYRKT